MFVIAKMKNKTYHAEDSGFTICKCEIIDQSDDIDDDTLDEALQKGNLTVSGYFPVPMKNIRYKFVGKFVRHKKFGMQFNVEHIETLEDDTHESVVAYLSSDDFEGVGEKTAIKIVDKLGKDAVEKIRADYTQIIGIVNERKAARIRRTILENEDGHTQLNFLIKYGFTPKLSMRIIKHYGDNYKNIINNDPYQIYFDMYHVSFEDLDEIILKNGFPRDNSLRVQSIIMYVLKKKCFQRGYTYLTEKQLFSSLIKKLSNVDNHIIGDALEELSKAGKLICEDKKYFESEIFNAEVESAKILKVMVETKSSKKMSSTIIDRLEKSFDIKYEEKQKEAIINSVNETVSIITGGPGTGKTTTVSGIIEALIDSGIRKENIELISPTGKASKRLATQTNLPAKTIHRFLGYEGENNFRFGEENKVRADVVVIDEFSMVDVNLLYQLLLSLNLGTKVIIIGDNDQLPSVSPGQTLKDLIDSKVIKTTKLDKIHRQSEESQIIKIAHEIKNNTFDPRGFEFKGDARHYPVSANDLEEYIIRIIKYALDKGQVLDDIQVLAPMYRGPAGIDNINSIIQRNFNSGENKKYVKFFDKLYKESDRVIQLKNREDGIMNGDVGIIHSIRTVKNDTKITVLFDERMVEYDRNELSDLNLAYCLSVHKSQGSEYKTVIMPIFKSYSIMLKKNIIYTGITRAKKSLLILGDIMAFAQGCNTQEENRQTILLDKMYNSEANEDIVQKNEISDTNSDESEEMENISPYDFM